MSFKVCTYNVGQEFDYRNVLLRTGEDSQDPEVKTKWGAASKVYSNEVDIFNNSEKKIWWKHPQFQVSKNEQELIGQDRIVKIQEVYRNIFSNSDIVLLQEVKTLKEIADIKKTYSNDFGLVYERDPSGWSDGVDTVVFYNKSRFKKLTPETNETTKCKISNVKLQEKTTQKVVQVASVHIGGFNILDPKKDLKPNESELRGDKDVSALLNSLDEDCKDVDLRIVGGDFNGEYKPNFLKGENYKLAQNRFTLLENASFNRVKADNSTSYNGDISKISGREDGLCCLDHLFIRNINGLAKANLCTEEKLTYPLEDVSKNPSDHRPLFFNVRVS